MIEGAKGCPFCGGLNLSANADALENDGTGIVASIACEDCGDMEGPMSEFKYDDEAEAVADAVRQWNRRAA